MLIDTYTNGKEVEAMPPRSLKSMVQHDGDRRGKTHLYCMIVLYAGYQGGMALITWNASLSSSADAHVMPTASCKEPDSLITICAPTLPISPC